MNVLLANAECRNPPTAVLCLYPLPRSKIYSPPKHKENPPRLKPRKVSTINELPLVTCWGYKTLAIDRFVTRRLERNHRIFSASSANSWEHLAFLMAIATAALVLCFLAARHSGQRPGSFVNE